MAVLTGDRTTNDGDRASDGRAGRIPWKSPSRFDAAATDDVCTGVTKNICSGGVFVATLRSFTVGERVAVRLKIPGDAEPVEALAEVRWSRPFQELDDCPAGFGLRFIDTPSARRGSSDHADDPLTLPEGLTFPSVVRVTRCAGPAPGPRAARGRR